MFISLLGLAMMVLLVACPITQPDDNGDDTNGSVTLIGSGMVISGAIVNLTNGESYQLTAIVSNTTKELVWTSSNTNVVTVAGNMTNALVTATGGGSTVITVAIQGTSISDSVNVAVKADTVLNTNVFINEVFFSNSSDSDNTTLIVELWNDAGDPADVSDWQLCTGPGEYLNITSSSATSTIPGDGIIPGTNSDGFSAGDNFVTVVFSQSGGTRVSGSVGLYIDSSYTSSDSIVSFVQWGAGGGTRANVAVSAGVWPSTEANIPVVYSISFVNTNASNNYLAADWKVTSTNGLGSFPLSNQNTADLDHVFISEVAFVGDNALVEIVNPTDAAVDIGSYQLCHTDDGGRGYRGITSVLFISGDYNTIDNMLAANGVAVFNFNISINRNVGDIGLYSSSSFGSTSAIVSYVQYGRVVSTSWSRTSVATGAGIWAATDQYVLNNFSVLALSPATRTEVSGWILGDGSRLGVGNGGDVSKLLP